MGSRGDLDAISKACIHAARLIEEDGSPALRKAMRVVLYILGREIAGRTSKRDGFDGHADDSDAQPDKKLPN